MNSIHSKIFLVAAGLYLFAFGLGCTSDDDDPSYKSIDHEINEDLDFTTYKTFDIVDPLGDAPGDIDAGAGDGGTSEPGDDAPGALVELNDEIQAAIETEMLALGLTRDTVNPDLMASPLVRVSSGTETVGFYDYFYGFYWGYEYTWTIDVDYELGTLIIDVVDLGDAPDGFDDVLAFRGVAEGVMAEDQAVVEIQLRNAVNAIFAGWPEPEDEAGEAK